ncbi:hypothetical protein [Salinithrix halophila]|uniref:Preprotein translocase subunit SecE n=1 Tax=Salinithrix halophila TaxID=1485204 RepID=A0ABV8JE62_9BACL
MDIKNLIANFKRKQEKEEEEWQKKDPADKFIYFASDVVIKTILITVFLLGIGVVGAFLFQS